MSSKRRLGQYKLPTLYLFYCNVCILKDLDYSNFNRIMVNKIRFKRMKLVASVLTFNNLLENEKKNFSIFKLCLSNSELFQ